MSKACIECGCRGCKLIEQHDSVEVLCSGCGRTLLAVANEYLQNNE